MKLSSSKTPSLWLTIAFWLFIFNTIAASASLKTYSSQTSRNESVRSYPPVITEQPEDWLVETPETNVRLNCRARGHPEPTISWRKDGIPLNEAFVNSIVQLTTSELTFLRVRNSGEGTNTGIYQCSATNYLGTAWSRNASVQMTGIDDKFRKEPRDTVGALGHSATIECKGPEGVPEPKISWKKDKEKLSTLIPKSRFQVKPSGDLVIHRLQKSDSGSYECVASNNAGERISAEALLMVQEPPQITVVPTDQTIQTGRTVELQCNADGDPRPSIQWSKIDGTLSERSISIDNGNMRIIEAKVEDSGEYVCTALNRVGMDKASAVITVQEDLGVNDFARNSSVLSGKTVTLPCNVKGISHPTAIWRSQHYDNDMQAERSYLDGHFFVTDNGELTINNARFDDRGQYVCQVATTHGSATENIKLVVQPRQGSHPPIIKQGPANVSASVNSDVILECSSRRVPLRDIRWYKNGVLVETGLIKSRMVKQSPGSLTIFDVKVTDSGRYTCKVSNDYGMATCSSWLTVHAQEFAIAPLSRDDVPRAPGKPVLINSTSSYVTVTWKSSLNTRGLVQHYVLDYYRVGSSSLDWSRLSPILNNIYILRHLSPSSAYIFVARTRNQHGISNPSPVSKIMRTIEPPRIDPVSPEVPKPLDGIFVTMTQSTPLVKSGLQTGSIRLQWNTKGGCEAIDGFVASARPVVSKNSELFTKQVSCSQRTVDVPNLVSGNKYEVRVSPFKDLSIGPASPIVFVSLQAGMIEAAPPLLNAKAASNGKGKILFLWQPPRDLPAAYVSSYVLTCHAQDGTFSRTIKVNSSTTDVVLAGLHNNVAYDATVTYFTQLGKGVTSNKRTVILKEIQTEVSDLDGEKSTSWFQHPAIIAGCAVALLVVIISCIVGGVCCQRSKRKWKTKSLNGSHRSARFDPTMRFDAGFQITKSVTPSGTGGNVARTDDCPDFSESMEHGNRNRNQNSSTNPMVTYNPTNGEIENYVQKHSLGAVLANQPSFSYVTNQLTCKSDIPPQFTRANLSTQASLPSQQLHYHHRLMARSNNVSELEANFEASQYLGSTNNIHGSESLPPPPPSPPLSQRTWISDRSHVSSNFQSTGSSRSGQRSRRVVRENKLTNELVGKQHLTDTDTGIDSPANTPSTTRPEDLCRNSSPAPPTLPVRGSSNLSYGYPPWQSDLKKNPSSILGYIGDPSEGDTNFEYERFVQLQGQNFSGNHNPTNGLRLTNSSNVRIHLPELHVNDLPYDIESLTSGEDSFHMESVSQVGKNFPHEDQASPRHGCTSKSREKNVKEHYSKAGRQIRPDNLEENQQKFNPIIPKPSKRHAGKSRRPKKNLSSTKHVTRSSRHHHCRKDHGVRIGEECLAGNDGIPDDEINYAETERTKMHQSAVAQNVPYDVTPTNQNIDKLPRLDLSKDPSNVKDQDDIHPIPVSPTTSEFSEHSAYFSTASSCLSFKPLTSTNQTAQSRSQYVGLVDQVSENPFPQWNKKSTPGMEIPSSNIEPNVDVLSLSHHDYDEVPLYRGRDNTPTNSHPQLNQ